MMQPRSLGDFLPSILRDLGHKKRRAALQEALEHAVGESAAPSCHVVGLRAGRLVIEVASAPLFAELRGFRADELRQAINAELGRPEVTQILFRMGGTSNV
ncbi:MAG: DUF721 domain-containing protein [Planctomycetota bacterium]